MAVLITSPALVVRDLLGFLDLALDQGRHLVLALILQAFEEQLPGLLDLHRGDLEQLVLLLGDQDGELLVLHLDIAQPAVQLLFLLLDGLLLLLEELASAASGRLPAWSVSFRSPAVRRGSGWLRR